MVYLWRAVDAEGEVLDVLVQTRPAWLNSSPLLSKPYPMILANLTDRLANSVR
jgi:hypothetical protein